MIQKGERVIHLERRMGSIKRGFRGKAGGGGNVRDKGGSRRWPCTARGEQVHSIPEN